METCEEQISDGTFSYMKRIRPRRVVAVDEQRGLVSVFALFIHDGTRRNATPNATPEIIDRLVGFEIVEHFAHAPTLCGENAPVFEAAWLTLINKTDDPAG
jgi:hypothetical protein